MKTFHLSFLLMLGLGAGCAAPKKSVRMNASMASRLAAQLANARAVQVCQCQPFDETTLARLTGQKWTWTQKRGNGPADVEARVSFDADGSNRRVEVLLLDNRVQQSVQKP